MAKLKGRPRRKQRIRKKVSGSSERPRLTVFRSLKQIYCQVVDDDKRATLASAASLGDKGEGSKVQTAAVVGSKVQTAAVVGEKIAAVCLEKGIKQVVFDRNGYLYQGRVKALAEGARKGGLEF